MLDHLTNLLVHPLLVPYSYLPICWSRQHTVESGGTFRKSKLSLIHQLLLAISGGFTIPRAGKFQHCLNVRIPNPFYISNCLQVHHLNKHLIVSKSVEEPSSYSDPRYTSVSIANGNSCSSLPILFSRHPTQADALQDGMSVLSLKEEKMWRGTSCMLELQEIKPTLLLARFQRVCLADKDGIIFQQQDFNPR